MELGTLKSLLIGSSLSTFAATAAVVGWACFDRVPGPVASSTFEQPIVHRDETPRSASSGFPTFEALLGLQLQGPPPKISQTQTNQDALSTPAAQEIFDIQLLGVIKEGTRLAGLFRDRSGLFDLKPIGTELELNPSGVTVEAIDVDAATVRYSGRTISLPLNPPKVTATNVSNNANTTSLPANSSYNPAVPIPSLPGLRMPAMNGSEVSTDEEDIFAPLPENMVPGFPMEPGANVGTGVPPPVPDTGNPQ